MAGGNTQHPSPLPSASAPRGEVDDGLLPVRPLAAGPRHVLWVYTADAPDRVAYVSPSFERIWGRPVAALYADPRQWLEGIHPDDRAAVAAAYDIWVADPEAHDFDIEYRVVRPDGAVHLIHDVGHAVTAPGGARQLTGIAEDVTERRRHEAALREQLHYFRDLTETLSQLVWGTRPDGHCDYLSPQWLQYTGVPAHAQHGDGWLELVHPDDRGAVAQAWRGAVRADGPYHIEMRLRRHDGAYRWFMTRGRPLRDGDGQVRHWFGTCTDIDDMRRARDELQRQHDRFEIIAATSPSVVHSLRRAPDGNFSVTYGAERMAEMYGVPPELLARDAILAFRAHVHPDDLPRLGMSVERSFREHTPWRAQFRVRHPERGERWMEAHSMPTHAADGSTVWHGTVTDITERRESEGRVMTLNNELERRVSERTAELQRTASELEAFSYSVSHDLRAPLLAIDGFAKLVLERCAADLSADGRRFVGIIRDSSTKMTQLIDDLLAFSRLGRQAPGRHPVDMQMLVRDALATLAPMREGREVTFCVAPLPPCEGDPAMLRQVWINLLSNALKYTRLRPMAKVEVGFRDGAYYVRDNGAGFDMKHAHKLFQVFERLHRAEDFEGSGVGLAIVQRVVERHGGAVGVDAVPDQGATFRFTIGGAAPAA